ncbi:MAG: gfo/Idh/MocA family oxidoreductase [Verrucomicrobia bacterium]|nr:MAG: gfo/Idh/MocA family oxidoreductase [Verrucomicrobiota bacterium]
MTKTIMKTTRRRFLKIQAGALGALALPEIVPASVLGQNAPSNRIAVGCIGVGPQGRGDMRNFLHQNLCRVVALCDISGRHLKAAVDTVSQVYGGAKPMVYHHYEDLLARPDIDAVLIATPDHWHVPVALEAARQGKDMYLEKPMGLSVEDDQELRAACRRHGRIFQFGTQQRSARQFRQACELVRNGRIGQLKNINVWCVGSRPGGSTDPIDPPKDLDYPTWLGPAPKTPYTLGKAYDENGAWKTWWYNYDYALGFIAGWGVHPLDIALWGHPAMMNGPMTVSGKAVFPEQGACNTAIAWDVKFEFADGVTLHYRATRNGAPAMPMNDVSEWRRKYGRIVDHGTAFEGTDGWVVVDRTQIRTHPEELLEEKPDNYKVRLPQSYNHARNFLEAVRDRRPAICPIDEAVQADILCHLSDIASRLGRRLTWDPQKERFTGDEEANRRLRKRPGGQAPA